MAFTITITSDAGRQLKSLTARQQRLVEASVQSRLVSKPTTESKAIKRLRPNPLAQFELRVGNLRVLYNVQETEVVLLLVGIKSGNKLTVEGREFYGHQDSSA